VWKVLLLHVRSRAVTMQMKLDKFKDKRALPLKSCVRFCTTHSIYNRKSLEQTQLSSQQTPPTPPAPPLQRLIHNPHSLH
jgi:hypothetical protein